MAGTQIFLFLNTKNAVVNDSKNSYAIQTNTFKSVSNRNKNKRFVELNIHVFYLQQ